MLYGLIYISIALIFAYIAIWAEANKSSSGASVIEDREDGFFFILLISIWPITLAIIGTMLTFEYYKGKVRRRIGDKLDAIKKDPTTMGQLSVDDLKYIVFAAKIEAVVADDKLIEKVKHNITDRSFEEYLLKSKSETKEK